MRAVLAASLVSLLVSILGTPLVVVFFRRRGFGHEIRQDGPPGHLVKPGTPTMGGVAIIAATVAGYAVAAAFKWFRDGVGPSASAYLALFAMAGFGLVGLLDDRSDGRLLRVPVVERRSRAPVHG